MTRYTRLANNGWLAIGLLIWVAGAGCDGLVAVSGWVVPGDGSRSEFRASGTKPAEPNEVIQGARVELWTADGRELLDKWECPHGEYSLAYVGPYYPRMEYLIKASAPGYAPLKQEIVLTRMQGVFGNVVLVPFGSQGRKDTGSQPAS